MTGFVWKWLHDDTQLFDAVANNGAAYDLYDSSAMLNLGAGQTDAEISYGNARLTLQMFESGDLSEWTPAGDAVEWVFPVGPGHKFFKVGLVP
jgi:hypothetical protein